MDEHRERVLLARRELRKQAQRRGLVLLLLAVLRQHFAVSVLDARREPAHLLELIAEKMRGVPPSAAMRPRLHIRGLPIRRQRGRAVMGVVPGQGWRAELEVHPRERIRAAKRRFFESRNACQLGHAELLRCKLRTSPPHSGVG